MTEALTYSITALALGMLGWDVCRRAIATRYLVLQDEEITRINRQISDAVFQVQNGVNELATAHALHVKTLGHYEVKLNELQQRAGVDPELAKRLAKVEERCDLNSDATRNAVRHFKEDLELLTEHLNAKLAGKALVGGPADSPSANNWGRAPSGS